MSTDDERPTDGTDDPTLALPADPVTDAPAAAAPARAPEGPERHGPRLRVSTVVWGLVIATVGIGLLAWASGSSIDVQLAVIVLLGAAGAALLLGSIVSGARHSRR